MIASIVLMISLGFLTGLFVHRILNKIRNMYYKSKIEKLEVMLVKRLALEESRYLES